MVKTPLIKPVEDNKAKNKTYSRIMQKYNEAMENGFYGEAELIVYAYLEDQLKGFIYYSDGMDVRNSRKINDKLQVITGCGEGIDDITAKISVIEKLLKLCDDKTVQDDYIKYLRQIYKVSIKPSELKSQLKKVRKWCEYRNEIIHSLLNKDIDALHEGYESHVREGFNLARYIDTQVRSLRRA